MSDERTTPGGVKPLSETRVPEPDNHLRAAAEENADPGEVEAGSEARGVEGSIGEGASDGEGEVDAAGQSAAPEAPAEASSGEEEIDLTGGRTLSDYVEDDETGGAAAAVLPEAKDEPVLRAIPNAVGLVMPPPPGAQHGVKRAPVGKRSAPSPEPAGEEASFGEMLARSQTAKTFEEGQTVSGVLVAIRPDVAFLDIGGKSEVPIDIEELKDEEGDIEFEVGDTVEAIVVSAEEGTRLSRKLARGAAAAAQLGDAYRAGLPVEGRVDKAIKGGYEVRVAGRRGFCPLSQIDKVRTADPSVHVGQSYTFRIIEYKDGGKNLVLSRRVLLQEEERARAEENRKKIVVGAVLPGRVVSVREYGAFVDLGGTQGLLHVSEMGWARVSSPGEMLKPGDDVTVKVLKIDEQKGRIGLGIKQLQPDPWTSVAERYSPGQIVPGRIVRLQDFGAFVELEPGIEGLAHVSTFPPTGTPDGWKGAAPAGTTGQFEILSVDTERKRIGIAMLEEGHTRASQAAHRRTDVRAEAASGEGTSKGEAAHEAAPGEASGAGRASGARGGRRPSGGAPTSRVAIEAGMRMKGKVERHEKYGVFVFLAPGRTGLLPAAESGESRGTDLRKVFPIGTEVEVMVLEVEPSGRRIRLSRKALLDAEERSDAKAYVERRQPVEAFGSIGEKLRAALEGRKK